MIICIGCAREPDSNAVDRASNVQIVVGGPVEDSNRDKAEW